MPHHCDMDSIMSTSTSRNYVDPWDLENYAFMKRHCTDAETEYVVTSSQSDFYYVPQPDSRHFPRYVHHESQDDSIGLPNGVEEEDFYNERYELYSFKPYTRTEGGDSYEDYDPEDYSDDSTALMSHLYSPSVLLRRAPSHESDQSLVYVYETGARSRKMALPKGHLGPTLLRRHSTNDYRSRRHSRLSPDVYPDIDPPYMMTSYDDSLHPYYDIYCSKPYNVTPQHFGLSKYGHLKIDYSFSWNSLDRYIATD